MSKISCKAAWALSVIITTFFCASAGFSQHGTRWAPPSGQPYTPRLGIHGRMHAGWGMIVDSVLPGTTAARMGLERGDVIVMVNGEKITCSKQWQRLMRRAMWQHNGRVTIKVDNIRARYSYHTPRYAFVTGWLDTVHVVLPATQPRATSHQMAAASASAM